MLVLYKRGSMFNGSYNYNTSTTFETNVQINKTKYIDFKPTPVCLLSPFLFIISNNSVQDNVLNCSENCFLSACWNATQFSLAIIARIPTFIPVPVKTKIEEFPVLLRTKRDFGITPPDHCHCPFTGDSLGLDTTLGFTIKHLKHFERFTIKH
uniref:Uncharacterized protein n=1 Tax=Urocitellus parryii TaxID=9999 RepID=A0A8D2GRS6_UROPR